MGYPRMSDKETFEPIGSSALCIVAGLRRMDDAINAITKALEAEVDRMKQTSPRTRKPSRGLLAKN
jgi:hypothetical protein